MLRMFSFMKKKKSHCHTSLLFVCLTTLTCVLCEAIYRKTFFTVVFGILIYLN